MSAALPRSVGFLVAFPRRRPDGHTGVGLFSRAFARAYLTTMRPYLFFVSCVTGLLGLALGPAIGLLPTLLLATVFFLSYGFGQALTDCFQTDTDALSAPYRPLVRGLVRRRDVLTVSLVGLAACGAVLAAASRLNLALVTLSIVGLTTYTWFKRRWWAGPFYNAWIVAALLLIGLLSASGVAGVAPTWPRGATGALVATFGGYANFVLAGYFKDITADRVTGYRTLPVVRGRRTAAVVSDVFAAAAATGVLAALVRGGVLARAMTQPLVILLLGLGVAASLAAQWRLHRVASDAAAHGPIALVVHAYILLLGGLVAAFRPGWALPLALFYGAFVLTLRRRPMRQQI